MSTPTEHMEDTGPDRQGAFQATLPNGDFRLVRYWDELESVKQESGVDVVRGELLNLKQRVRPRTRF
jgi:hypothetical protein